MLGKIIVLIALINFSSQSQSLLSEPIFQFFMFINTRFILDWELLWKMHFQFFRCTFKPFMKIQPSWLIKAENSIWILCFKCFLSVILNDSDSFIGGSNPFTDSNRINRLRAFAPVLFLFWRVNGVSTTIFTRKASSQVYLSGNPYHLTPEIGRIDCKSGMN